jgi:hypothetical protein
MGHKPHLSPRLPPQPAPNVRVGHWIKRMLLET